MRRILLFICSALAAFSFAFIMPALADSQLFSISGQVIDATGSPVAGANVTLIDYAYNVIGVMKTDDNGSYDFVNVNSSTATITVRVSLDKNGKTYKVPSYYTRWYPAQGNVSIKSEETQFADYPEPAEGYLYGAIKSGTSADARFITGDVYLTSVSTGVKYHQVANNTDGKGSFYFHVPPGDYDIYAVHVENGKKTETATLRVTVQPAWNVNEHLPVVLVIEPGLIPLPLHMLPQISSPVPAISTPQATGFSYTPLALAGLIGLLLLTGLYFVFQKL